MVFHEITFMGRLWFGIWKISKKIKVFQFFLYVFSGFRIISVIYYKNIQNYIQFKWHIQTTYLWVYFKTSILAYQMGRA